MKRLAFITIMALTGFMANSGESSAAILTFEGLSDGAIANGYGGLNWNNMYALNATIYQPSGYKNGRVSGDNVAYNGFGTTATVTDGLFTFDGAYFTGAWNDGLNIRIQGYAGATLLYDTTIVVNTSGPTYFNAGYQNIDKLVFDSFGGVDNPAYVGGGVHFAMDNFSINESSSVPEPATLTMFGLGALGFGFAGYRRRKAAR